MWSNLAIGICKIGRPLSKMSVSSLERICSPADPLQWMGAVRMRVQIIIDGLESCGLLVDYCDVFISCLNSHSDGTHSQQGIHWWASDVMQHIIWYFKRYCDFSVIPFPVFLCFFLSACCTTLFFWQNKVFNKSSKAVFLKIIMKDYAKLLKEVLFSRISFDGRHPLDLGDPGTYLGTRISWTCKQPIINHH